MGSNKNKVYINEMIRSPNMLVIDETGNKLGVISRKEALALAENKNLDLVQIAQQKGSTICKLMDYGKFKYEQKRKQKENKKHQTIVKTKELKIKPLIGDHDLNVRVENAKRWLKEGNRVQFVIEARGRMCTKPEYVTLVYKKFIDLLGDAGTIQQAKKQVNNFRYETLIVPNKKQPKESTNGKDQTKDQKSSS